MIRSAEEETRQRESAEREAIGLTREATAQSEHRSNRLRDAGLILSLIFFAAMAMPSAATLIIEAGAAVLVVGLGGPVALDLLKKRKRLPPVTPDDRTSPS
jgi:hypothetical protein